MVKLVYDIVPDPDKAARNQCWTQNSVSKEERATGTHTVFEQQNGKRNYLIEHNDGTAFCATVDNKNEINRDKDAVFCAKANTSAAFCTTVNNNEVNISYYMQEPSKTWEKPQEMEYPPLPPPKRKSLNPHKEAYDECGTADFVDNKKDLNEIEVNTYKTPENLFNQVVKLGPEAALCIKNASPHKKAPNQSPTAVYYYHK